MLYILNKNNKLELIEKPNNSSIISEIEAVLEGYRYSHYRFYPSKNESGWKKLFLDSIRRDWEKKDYIFIYSRVGNYPQLLGFRINLWDEKTLGIKVATSQYIFSPDEADGVILKQIFIKQIKLLRKWGVKSIIFRCNGDHLVVIHTIGELGFQYYETIIWPIASLEQVNESNLSNVRLIKEDEYELVAKIASKHQYKRGHFYCDNRYNIQAIDKLYSNWVLNSRQNGAYVAIVEFEGQVAGYFVFKMDKILQSYLGYSFGRFSSLALSNEFRGYGLGRDLFTGTMKLIKNFGGDYVDSGYATKNHLSAKLHAMNSFYSNYEEVTFHYWL